MSEGWCGGSLAGVAVAPPSEYWQIQQLKDITHRVKKEHRQIHISSPQGICTTSQGGADLHSRRRHWLER